MKIKKIVVILFEEQHLCSGLAQNHGASLESKIEGPYQKLALERCVLSPKRKDIHHNPEQHVAPTVRIF